MATLDILPIDDPHLRNKTFPVDIESEDEIHRIRLLVSDMFETCKVKKGAGLAANQVGSHDRVFVMDMSVQGITPMAFINPQIIARSEETQEREEGCLSMPGVFCSITRSARVQIAFYDLNGAPQQYDASGYAAICCQHEIDHLDGIRHIDHVSGLKQMMLFQRWDKLKRLGRA